MSHPLAALFGPQTDESDHTHKLAPEAQAENLREAWRHYSTPKTFVAGQLLKGRKGLGVYQNEPVLLFVRFLDLSCALDKMNVQDTVTRQNWNKLDCVIAQVKDDGSIVFLPCDSDLLEPYEP